MTLPSDGLPRSAGLPGSAGSAGLPGSAGSPSGSSPRTIDIASLSILLEVLDASQVVAGAPRTGFTVVDTLGPQASVEIGVWEHSPGVSTDVEIDEVSLIVSGSATLSFLDSSGVVTETAELVAGTLLVLRAGERTRWDVREPLRKLYVAG